AVLALRATGGPGSRQNARVSVTVPNRLLVRIEGAPNGTTVKATGLSALQLGGVLGDVRLESIAGAISGSHRNGELSIDGAGAVDLTLATSRATIEHVRGTVTLNLRNGRCRIVDARAPVEVDATNNETTIVQPSASVAISGMGG